jgi:hypothetical protein
MNVIKEIKKYSSPADKNCLLWLFSKYHMQSEWSFVAKCNHVRYGTYSYETNRVWYPTEAGKILYNHRDEFE